MNEKPHVSEPHIFELDNDPVNRGLKALQEATPPSPRQQEIRHAFLASTIQTKGEPTVNRPRHILRKITAAAAAGAILLSLAVAISPDLRVLAQDIIDFFIPGETTRPTSVFINGEPEVSEDQYPLSIDELATRMSQPLYLPFDIPAGYDYDGGRYDPQQQTYTVAYRCDTLYSIGLTVHLIPQAEIAPFEVGDTANIVDVLINGTPGQYVRGFWVPQVDLAEAPGEHTELPAKAVWTDDSDFQQLWWYDTAAGMSFLLSTLSGSMHGSQDASPCSLYLEDFVTMAEGVQQHMP